MPSYSYNAKDEKGEDFSGTMEAGDKKELARALRQKGLVLIEAVSKKEPKKKKLGLSFSLGGVSLTDKMLVTRNLAVMIGAGISLPSALRMLSDQAKNKKFKKALLEIIDEIVKGGNFSDGLAKHPHIFSELFVNMVKVGEETGTLESVLKTLTLQMEREHQLVSEMKGALIYPAVVVFAMIGIGLLMLMFVVPRLAQTFEELNIELPLTTRIVIGVGVFLSNYWYLLPLIFLGLFSGLKAVLRTKKGKRTMDALLLRLPIVSPIVKKTNAASSVRSFSSLIAAGVPIVRSLEIVSGSLSNVYFKEALEQAAKEVRKGAKLSECLKSYQNIFPLIMVQMVAIGEETGQTSTVLAKLADFFEAEVTSSTKNLSAVIEPVLMLLVGGAVGFFAISMVQPMYSMLGSI